MDFPCRLYSLPWSTLTSLPPTSPPEDISGSKMEKACDLCHVTLNKNTVVGDANAINPGGVRIGEGGGGRGERGEREFKEEQIGSA